ncbi:MAG: helix-turn-helix domain-containing protein [Alphaproteobacteria bacterium]|nr:helix-turn-helix domain-containing protein [Alphaproteobacteria bacterium]
MGQFRKVFSSPALVEAGAQDRHGDYLRGLGERVRDWRARRGMTRKILSRDCGVSERYLAQLEAGQGNISIALLRQIAAAMDVPLHELVRDGAERPVELQLLEHRLARMSPDEQATAYRLISGSQPAARERQGRIALVGLRGAGKTTLGRALAAKLDVAFIRLDEEVEREAGMDLGEIFSLSGQAGYRRFERQALERIVRDHGRAVIETGGSLVSEPGTYGLLLETCLTVWITATPEDHMTRVIAQGDHRPIAGSREAMDDLKRILAGRETLYRKADLIIDTSGRKVNESLDDLMARLARLRASA